MLKNKNQIKLILLNALFLFILSIAFFQNCGNVKFNNNGSNTENSTGASPSNTPSPDTVLFKLTSPAEGARITGSGFKFTGTCQFNSDNELIILIKPLAITVPCVSGAWTYKYNGPYYHDGPMSFTFELQSQGLTVAKIETTNTVLNNYSTSDCEVFPPMNSTEISTASYDGTELMLISTADQQPEPPDYISSTNFFNPIKGTWRKMASPPSVGYYYYTYNLPNSRFIALGKTHSYYSTFDKAALFDKKSNSWIDISNQLNYLSDILAYQGNLNFFSTGNKVLIMGIRGGLILNTSDMSWSQIKTPDADTLGRYEGSVIWTGKKLIFWGGHGLQNDPNVDPLSYFRYKDFYSNGWIYDLDQNKWTSFNTPSSVAPRAMHAAVWTGKEMLIWGGMIRGGDCNNPASQYPNSCTNEGSAFDPESLKWRSLSKPKQSGRFMLATDSIYSSDGFFYIIGGVDYAKSNNIGTSITSLKYSVVDDTWTAQNHSSVQSCAHEWPAKSLMIDTKTFLRTGMYRGSGSYSIFPLFW